VGELYAKVTHQHGWLLRLAEDAFESSAGDLLIDQDFFLTLPTNRYPSDEIINVVQEALVEVGTIRRDGHSLRLDRQALIDNQRYREGVVDAIAALVPTRSELPQLCATIPNGLEEMVEKALRVHTLDLRGALLDLIASAETRIVLASPFWDLQTAHELAEALVKRLEDGVRVDLLGRFPSKDREIERLLLQRLGAREKCQVFAWHESGNEPKPRLTTFHFKAAAIDDGVRAYLGTANLTFSSLRSVMELGAIMYGDPAKRVLAILNVILSIASPISGQRNG
jgi:phosphatidylserine/phosphatidylglycerophosphate/cardiolipin synthase-like enzyme